MHDMRDEGPGGVDMINEKEQKFLLKLARKAIESHPSGVDVREDALTPVMKEKRGVFVTLTLDEQLRGCIGYIQPVLPLYEAVCDCAVNAAYADPRFRPVSADEFRKIRVEISVLTVPQPLDYSGPDDLLKKLTTDDGVVLKRGMRQATFLPQVWEDLPRKEDFLSHLSMKAGMSADAWKEPDITIEIYHVEKFKE